MSTQDKPAAVANPLKELGAVNQSVWLDYIRRDLITSGELRRLIEQDGLRGMTSNPAIFEKAISSSPDYDHSFATLDGRDRDAKTLFEELAIEDIQDAADALRGVYDASEARDGYVSLEVSPYLAHDTAGTLEEARRLWQAVARPNVMIKVPGTAAGAPAFRQLTSEGVNVNVTLLFAIEAYETIARAYIDGLEDRVRAGGAVHTIASVASFFVSRIDSLIDKQIEKKLPTMSDPEEKKALEGLLGTIAIANAKTAYQRYLQIFAGDRWDALVAKGARTQRVLWASTGTKNPKYSDVLYVEELIGPDTVNTMPPATVDAFRDHGRVGPTLTDDVEGAQRTLQQLERLGISLRAATDTLLDDAITLFADPFDKLLSAVERKREAQLGARLNRFTYEIGAELGGSIKTTIDAWRREGRIRRLWARDASVWTGADEAQWLGWLDIVEAQAARVSELDALAADVKAAGFSHALLLGMGGSSLCPDVLRLTFGSRPGFPELLVLDSTDPAQVRAFEERVDLARTLFIVSSKSGSTLEPEILREYFFDRARSVVGADEVGRRFIAITDPGSKLQQTAERDGFRRVFLGRPTIGGRYSALSDFGMVPAAIMGLDTRALLESAQAMVRSCGPFAPPDVNHGVGLGAILGCAHAAGRDKLTLVASPGIVGLGAWLEQLIAESTGKIGKAIIPVDLEPLGAPSMYGADRVFAYLRLESAPDAAQDAAVAAIEQAGHPVVRIALADASTLAQEFFRWEIATATAGAIMRINPFDQPDVEASKIATKELTTAFERDGALPIEHPALTDQGVQLFADGANAARLKARAGADQTLVGWLRAHFTQAGAGDYVALLAYVHMTEAARDDLQQMRRAVRDARQVATCVGFGPRFLHSTGQAYKGGPNTAVVLQITCDDGADLRAPSRKATFGVVKAAQARGDLQVLVERGRRALRVHLGPDAAAGLAVLRAATAQALA